MHPSASQCLRDVVHCWCCKLHSLCCCCCIHALLLSCVILPPTVYQPCAYLRCLLLTPTTFLGVWCACCSLMSSAGLDQCIAGWQHQQVVGWHRTLTCTCAVECNRAGWSLTNAHMSLCNSLDSFMVTFADRSLRLTSTVAGVATHMGAQWRGWGLRCIRRCRLPCITMFRARFSTSTVNA